MAEQQRTSWAVVAAAIGAGVVAASHIGKVPPAMPVVRAELGLSIVAASWLVSLFNVLGLTAGLLMGGLCDRIGHRRAAVSGLLVLALGGVAGAAAQGVFWLLASRVLEGVGFILVVVSVPGLIIAASAPPDRRLSLGVLGTYMPIGITIAILLAPRLISSIGWRGLWLAVAGVAVVMAVLLGALSRDLPRLGAAPRGAAAPAGGLLGDIALTLRQPGLWLLALSFAAYACQWIALMAWLPSFLIESRGASGASAALLTALFTGANIPGNVLGGWLLHRHVRRWWLISGASLAMGLASLGIFSDALPDWLRFVLCLNFSFWAGLLPAAALSGAAAQAPTPRQIGTANGLLNQGSNLGQFIGPPAVAALVTATGSWHSASGLLVGAAVLAGVAGYAATFWERPPAPAAQPAPQRQA